MKILLTIINICVLFEVVYSSSPRDVVSDAKLKLQELHSLVLSSIQQAQDAFVQDYTDIVAYNTNMMNLGFMAIDQVYQDVSAQLTQIKQLAQAAGKDISYCTGGREQMINKLPDELKDRILNCLGAENDEAMDVITSSIYIVDVTINKVHNLEFQLSICGDSELCVSPLLTEIENDMVKIPQQIKVEVSNANLLLQDIKLLMKECEVNNVADFTGYVTTLIEQIADCANRIIG